MHHLPELLTALALSLLSLFAWSLTRRPSFRVEVAPAPRQLWVHRGFHLVGAAISLAVVLWIAPAPAPIGDELQIHTHVSGSFLPLFFLWMCLAGAVSFTLSCVFLGSLVRPVKGHAPFYRLDHRLMSAAALGAEAAARRNPRIEIAAYLGMGLLSLAAEASIEGRRVDLGQDELVLRGFLPTSGERISWNDIDRLEVLPRPEHPGIQALSWHLTDGERVTVHRDDLWSFEPAIVLRIELHHRELGIDVERLQR